MYDNNTDADDTDADTDETNWLGTTNTEANNDEGPTVMRGLIIDGQDGHPDSEITVRCEDGTEFVEMFGKLTAHRYSSFRHQYRFCPNGDAVGNQVVVIDNPPVSRHKVVLSNPLKTLGGDVLVSEAEFDRVLAHGASDESSAYELVTDGGREVNDNAEDVGGDTGAFVFDNASAGESQSDEDTSGNDAADANDTADESDVGQEVAIDALTDIDGVGDVLAGRIVESFGGETGHQTLRNVSHAAASAWSELAEVNGISDGRARGFFEEMRDAGVLATPNKPDADACEAVGIDPNIGSSRSLRPHQVREFSRAFDRTEARDADVPQLSYTNDDNTATLVARGSDRFPNEDDVVDISEFDVTVAPDNVFRADTVSTQWKTKDETRENVLVIEWSHDNPDVDGIDGDGLQRTILSADMADRIEDMTDETIDELTKTQAFRVSNEFRYSDGFGPVCVDLTTPSGVLVLAPCIVPGHSTSGFSGPDHRYDIQRIGESDGSDRDSHDDTDRDDHDGHGETSNTESKAETELAADGGTDTGDSTDADSGPDDQGDHSDEADSQDRERPLQRASDAFDDLREGDVIEVAQYQGALRVSSIARDVGMVGIEFVDESKRANGATKHLIQNEHSGDIALVSGRSDKGKVAMITVLERSQDGRESQDDDESEDPDDHEGDGRDDDLGGFEFDHSGETETDEDDDSEAETDSESELAADGGHEVNANTHELESRNDVRRAVTTWDGCDVVVLVEDGTPVEPICEGFEVLEVNDCNAVPYHLIRLNEESDGLAIDTLADLYEECTMLAPGYEFVHRGYTLRKVETPGVGGVEHSEFRLLNPEGTRVECYTLRAFDGPEDLASRINELIAYGPDDVADWLNRDER